MANKTFEPEALRYDDRGLIPAVVQDASTGQVLMLAYMNEASVKKTLETGYTWFYSRSRQALWQKGESSGHVQKVMGIATDCDQDAIVVQVTQTGVACHTGQPTCFHHSLQGAPMVKGSDD